MPATPANAESTRAAIEQSAWGPPVSFFQPHNPACYLYWALVLWGAYLYFQMVSANAIYPAALLIGIASQILYCLPWVWFLRHRDRYERQPAKLALLAFLWGGLVATWVMSVPGNDANLSLMVKLIGLDFHNKWGPAFTAPVVEESSKYLGLIVLALLARNHFRSAYDGFLLGAFVCLGFQVFENVLYVVHAAAANFGSQEVADALRIIGIRTAVGFWSHALFSAIAGTGLGYFLGATNRSFGHRLMVAIGFFLLACVAHGVWDAGLGFVGFTLIGVLLGTIGIIAAWRFSEGRQRDFIGVLLADEVSSGTITDAELGVIAGKPKARRAYLKSIQSLLGPAEAKRARSILDSIIDLAAAIASTNNPDSAEAVAARSALSHLREASV